MDTSTIDSGQLSIQPEHGSHTMLYTVLLCLYVLPWFPLRLTSLLTKTVSFMGFQLNR